MAQLRRSLGLVDAVAVGLTAMVGAGVFVAFAPATERAGRLVWAALAVAAAVAVCNAMSSARLAVRYPDAGGTYVFGKETLGPRWGHMAGWSFIIGKTASCAAMALTVGHHLWPAHANAIAVATVLTLTVLNVAGVQRSAFVGRVIVAVVLSILCASIIALWLSDGTTTAAREVAAGTSVPQLGGSMFVGAADVWSADVGIAGVLGGAGMFFFAFAGYARITTLGEEVKSPERTIPAAIGLAVAIVVVVYAALLASILHVLGLEAVGRSVTPLVDAVALTGFAWLAAAVKMAAVLAAVGALLALILGVSRTALAMARDRHLPGILANVHSRNSVPYIAEIAVGITVAIAVAFVDVRGAIGFSSFGVLVYYSIANLSSIAMPDGRSALTIMTGVLGLVGCMAMAVNLPVTSVITGTIVVVIGLAVFSATQRSRGTQVGSPETIASS